jgi:uncharacterized protein YdhG (YjbR/CyaY superfamily)
MTTSAAVDEYLSKLTEPKRSTLEQVRRTILELLPDAEECISYRLPAYRVGGKVVAGYGAFKNHLTYVPHSGSVLDKIPETQSYGGTKSALHFPVDTPLPRNLLAKLLEVRMKQAALR